MTPSQSIIENGRTHEPDLRELAANVDSLGTLMEVEDKAIRDLLNERDRRVSEQFEAQKAAVFAALSAQEKMTAAAFASAEKAIDKAEAGQKSYNERSNEFRGQLDDQAKTFIPRNEADSRDERTREAIEATRKEMGMLRDEIRREVADLRKTRDESSGKGQGLTTVWTLGLASIIVIISVLTLIFSFWKH